MERFSRLTQLIGEDKFSQLSGKHVSVIGLGAVGGFAAEALARCGIGHITLADFDLIAVTNINRHIGALDCTVGRAKVDVIKERIAGINPECTVNALKIFAHIETFPEIFKDKPDIIIDAVDSLGPKIELLSWAVENSIEIVSSMGAALRTDPSKIKTADISETDVCPLAKNLRKYLRRRGITNGITCVYSDEIPEKKALRRPESESEKEDFIRGRERNILGSYPVITAIFGLLAADEAIKKLIIL
ncbi:MAG: tRNA threonylcarbamoyladenosine dehydratase [Spirochaetia bacterium]|jgi:tRNA A37 threonylcarbamoyladenosine dehydratase|nr:tRNA threonylcarbamoyladenosine dehydratase [Spirochaetia bacterium]